jgi:dipeptidyl aminopeptidase/acylaminoacyl peptidase
MKGITLAVIFLAILPPLSSGVEKITFNDLYSIPRVSDAQFSPDGRQIAFALTTTDIDEESSVSHIWTINRDGTGLRQLTTGSTGEWNPRWPPNGKSISFESDRDGSGQIWLLPLEGGEARKLTSLSTGAWGAVWSPRSDRITFVSEVYPDCESDSCNAARLKEIEDNPIEARLHDHLLYRHYNSWDDGKVSQLFEHDIDKDRTYQLTFGPYDAPTATLGGYTDYAISNDGSEICYVMNTDSIPTLSTNNDLFIHDSTAGQQIRITSNPGQDVSPFYSPDDKYIAYLSQDQAGYESDQFDLILYDRKSGTTNNLTEDFDRSVGYFRWGPKSRYIYFLALNHGFNMVWRIDVTQKEVESLLSDAVYRDLAVSPDGKALLVARSLSDQPYELYLFDLASKNLTRLTYFTEDIIGRIDVTRAGEFWFEGALGDSVHGFLTFPPDYNAQNKYPLILLIHGGPQWCWLGDFNYYGWNTQLTAAQGYVVAQIDPHGSAGYGAGFKEYVSGNWGRADYEDLMLGVDYLIGEYPAIDSNRMAALGRSYGGFMTNWICGHTDRFKCLITIDGTFNHVSDYYSTDELWFPEWEFKGTPWTNYEEYRRSSPATYVENFRTPTMIIHGQEDYRVDVSEALAMYTALQRKGVPSQLLYFPDEGHSIRKLKNLRYVYEKQFEWLARWLAPEHE